MIYVVVQIIELILILFIMFVFNKIVREKKYLEEKVEELQVELDQHKYYKELSTNCIIKSLEKVKKYCIISKKDKIILIQWLMANLNEDLYLFNKINVKKTYTYKKACDTILNYTKHGHNKVEVMNAAFYLINLKK